MYTMFCHDPNHIYGILSSISSSAVGEGPPAPRQIQHDHIFNGCFKQSCALFKGYDNFHRELFGKFILVYVKVLKNQQKSGKCPSSRARTINFYFYLSIYSSRLCVACNEKLCFVYIFV